MSLLLPLQPTLRAHPQSKKKPRFPRLPLHEQFWTTHEIGSNITCTHLPENEVYAQGDTDEDLVTILCPTLALEN